MNGEIGLESAPGQGSRFWFEIALEKQPRRVGEPSPAMVSLARTRIVIADVHAATRESIRAMVQNWTSSHQEAATGAAASALLSGMGGNTDTAVVLIAGQLPDMSAEELAGRAAATGPNTRTVLMREVDAPHTPQPAGVQALLLKPVKQSQLYNALLTVVAGLPGITPGPETPPPLAAPSQLRLLVVEDHEINQRLVVLVLGKLGYQPTVVADGRAAIEYWRQFQPEVILMDCQLPVLDGYQATAEIRRLEAAGPVSQRPVHIIAVTANAMKGDQEKCLAAGMDDFVSKPLTREALAAALETASRKVKANR
jgi:CheY-like chemotaxis protein